MNSKIVLYQTLLWICLFCAGLCMGISVYVFIKFDILSVLGYLTGISEKKKMKELDQNANDSGPHR